MKLNIVTILLFTVLLSTGFSTKADAQHCGWRRHGYWAPEHSCGTACKDHHGCAGNYGYGRPWRWGWGSHCTAEMRDRAIADSVECAKHHEDMKAAHAKYAEGDAILHNSHHGYWGHGWGRWNGGWWGHNRYYYRGAGY